MGMNGKETGRVRLACSRGGLILDGQAGMCRLPLTALPAPSSAHARSLTECHSEQELYSAALQQQGPLQLPSRLQDKGPSHPPGFAYVEGDQGWHEWAFCARVACNDIQWSFKYAIRTKRCLHPCLESRQSMSTNEGSMKLKAKPGHAIQQSPMHISCRSGGKFTPTSRGPHHGM